MSSLVLGKTGRFSVIELFPTHAVPDAASLRWDLKGMGEARLKKLDLSLLRWMCEARAITISGGAHRHTCVKSLLRWKEQLKPPSPGGAPDPRPKSLVHGHTEREWSTRLNQLMRINVAGRAEPRSNCAYTLRRLTNERNSSDKREVEHIFECQAMGYVLFQTAKMKEILQQVDWGTFTTQTYTVQNALAHARDVHNRPQNLVLCGSLVNKKKQFAFQDVLNPLAEGKRPEGRLEDLIRKQCEEGASPSEPDANTGFGSVNASQIAKNVVRHLRDLEDPLTTAMRDVAPGLAQGRDQQDRYDGIADEIVQLYESFDITRRV